MEYQHELYAERLRRKAQAEALATGATQWTDQLDTNTRLKLDLAWNDVTRSLGAKEDEFLASYIGGRTLRSIGATLRPDAMQKPYGTYSNERLLSLIEAEHEALASLAEQQGFGYSSNLWGVSLADLPEKFQYDVNRIFEAHIVSLHLHHNSRLVPIDSHEMHSAVIAPTLHLLHSQPRFAGAETAYQNSLKELRNRDAGDAITDAAKALQEVLIGLGCTGGALGDLLNSAKKKGLLSGADTPLTESIVKTINWVAAKRNQGEAHRGDHQMNMSDAWMLVHVVGALAIRLSEANQPNGALSPQ
ncbi:hypothetical protein [Mycolicibacterium peregrinum]|uniref:Abortive infection protein-like C-terminal domain-containing protein n=1 Tax=Mycolicibacterium peregrinum TaxID=43304 RepID=A0A4Z0HYA6_MYCPR|nr:hypothetical protein [Mycolicibacterium peregrinum]TGB36975.1 hypothetical protein EJD98_28085 [Mycolicibacterium peregrinum]TGB46591.1 hypothetical protein EJD94_06585 [Mycolicibacterium peregrinum]